MSSIVISGGCCCTSIIDSRCCSGYAIPKTLYAAVAPTFGAAYYNCDAFPNTCVVNISGTYPLTFDPTGSCGANPCWLYSGAIAPCAGCYFTINFYCGNPAAGASGMAVNAEIGTPSTGFSLFLGSYGYAGNCPWNSLSCGPVDFVGSCAGVGYNITITQ